MRFGRCHGRRSISGNGIGVGILKLSSGSVARSHSHLRASGGQADYHSTEDCYHDSGGFRGGGDGDFRPWIGQDRALNGYNRFWNLLPLRIRFLPLHPQKTVTNVSITAPARHHAS